MKIKKTEPTAILILLGAYFLLFVGAIWGHRGDNVKFFTLLAAAIMTNTYFANMIITLNFNKHFDRLEDLLKGKEKPKNKDQNG